VSRLSHIFQPASISLLLLCCFFRLLRHNDVFTLFLRFGFSFFFFVFSKNKHSSTSTKTRDTARHDDDDDDVSFHERHVLRGFGGCLFLLISSSTSSSYTNKGSNNKELHSESSLGFQKQRVPAVVLIINT
jgi:hypothetical protein